MSSDRSIGGYRPCEDPKGPHVKEVAQWAVTEYNIKHRPEGHYLYLVRVLKCESQLVGGTNWRLLLECKDENNCVEIYEVVVWEKGWENIRELISFVRITPVLSHE